MYLSRLFIRNYRSIQSLDLRFRKGKNVIVGMNNAGKSNIIRAIDLVLGESQPTYAKSENVTINDFYTWTEVDSDGVMEVKISDELFVWCELSREDGEALNYEEMYKSYGLYVHVDHYKNNPVPIRIPQAHLPTHYDTIFNLNEDDIDYRNKLYVNPKLRNQQAWETQFEDKFVFAFALRAKREPDGLVSKDIRFLYCEDGQSDWVLAFRAPIRTELLQSAILTSFRDPQNQLRLTNWTWYGKLMRHLTRTHEESPELINAFAMVREVSDEIFAELRETIESTAVHVAFPGTSIHFRLNTDTKTELYKNCAIFVDDGFMSELGHKGAGIQSATIIGLFNYYTRHVNIKTAALLCLEEPEIYLHPHARRVISDRLDEFLDNQRNQVILTTHSVEFIRTTTNTLNVILVRKDASGTSARLVDAAQFKSILIDNNQNELFFAKTVIACEGYDEYVIRAIANELFPGQLDAQNVSIIAVSGKDRLCTLVKLVTKLDIRCFIAADFDFLLRDKEEERNLHEARAHDCIIDLPRSFFKQDCIFGPQDAEAKVQHLKDLRAQIKLKSAEQFYTAKHVSEIDDSEAVTETLKELRNNGICILSGEIEDLSQDKEFLSPDQKLTLGRVADLHDRLNAGKRASDLFDVDEFRDFLKAVFESAQTPTEIQQLAKAGTSGPLERGC